jgi:uncharacterized protein (DUF1697 family)
MTAEEKVGMRSFVALMRGINVGATRKLPMAELRALCPTLGLERAETYIQSGNLIVDAEGSPEDVRDLLERELTARFGFKVDVITRTATDWEAYVAANPFSCDINVLPKALHLYLSRDPVTSRAADALTQRALSRERIAFAGDAIWIDYGAEGIRDSKLTPGFIDKACGSPTTGRNWNSVLKIQEIISTRNSSRA